MIKRMVSTAAAASLGLLVCSAAIAQEAAARKDAQGVRMAAAFKDWAARWGVPDASFAAMRVDALIGSAKVGDRKPVKGEPVASLSKAITGVCVAKLVEAKKLKYRDKIGALLKDYFRKNKPADLAARQITVAELLTHSGGLAYDPTQGNTEVWTLDFNETNMPAILKLALARPLGAKTYFYNNVNYSTLGMVVEAVTGEDYETYCHRTVLEPVGAGAALLNPGWRIMGAFGGWRISAVDYAKFLNHFRPETGLLKSRPSSWPKVDLGNGAYYSIGVAMRQSGDSYNFWHSGAWTFTDPARAQSYGAYQVTMRQDLRYVANYAPLPAGNAVGDLDAAMWRAAYPESARAPIAASSAAAAAPVQAPGAWSNDGAVTQAIGRASAE